MHPTTSHVKQVSFAGQNRHSMSKSRRFSLESHPTEAWHHSFLAFKSSQGNKLLSVHHCVFKKEPLSIRSRCRIPVNEEFQDPSFTVRNILMLRNQVRCGKLPCRKPSVWGLCWLPDNLESSGNGRFLLLMDKTADTPTWEAHRYRETYRWEWRPLQKQTMLRSADSPVNQHLQCHLFESEVRCQGFKWF